MIKRILLITIIFSNAIFAQDNYLDFDGSNDYVAIPNSENVLANATSVTLSCKVFPKSITMGFPNIDGIAGYRNETNFDFYLVQLSASKVEARFRNSSGVAYSLTYNGLVLNQWNHFFLVYDGITLKLYSGATLVTSTAASGSVPATNNYSLKIGLVKFQAYNWYHNGYIDEVSLWDKALTSTDIGAIVANNGQIANPSSELNLKLYYKFNQGIPYGTNTGLTTLTDEKGLANGILDNFALAGNSSNWGNQSLTNNSFETVKNSVYPNPTSNLLTVSSQLTDITNFKIVDLSGRVIIERETNATQSITISVSELQSGIYLAIINDAKKIKFIKR